MEKEETNMMTRPTAKDFEEWDHDCWGVSSRRVNTSNYIKELNKYIDYLEKQEL